MRDGSSKQGSGDFPDSDGRTLAERIAFVHRRGMNPADVESIDAIITAAYDGISGPAGEKRDWDRERSLYFPGARLIPTAKAGENTALAPQILDIDAIHCAGGTVFCDERILRKRNCTPDGAVRLHGASWSTYESRHDPSDPEPFMRGINSIQLFHDGNRWWIVNIYWQQESSEHPIPEKYLEKGTDRLPPATAELRRGNRRRSLAGDSWRSRQERLADS